MVRLIQNKRPQSVRPPGSSFQVIEQPARGGDHEIDAAAEGPFLGRRWHSADDQGGPEWRARGETTDNAVDLLRQFAGWRQNQGPGRAARPAEKAVQ